MKPRYSAGSGRPPIHLVSINRERLGKGTLVFSGRNNDQQVPFATQAELVAMLRKLMVESVPLSVGGHCAGPADEVAMLIASGELEGSYVEISWSGPEQWIAREQIRGAVEWEAVDSPHQFANISFNPDALKRSG